MNEGPHRPVGTGASALDEEDDPIPPPLLSLGCSLALGIMLLVVAVGLFVIGWFLYSVIGDATGSMCCLTGDAQPTGVVFFVGSGIAGALGLAILFLAGGRPPADT